MNVSLLSQNSLSSRALGQFRQPRRSAKFATIVRYAGEDKAAPKMKLAKEKPATPKMELVDADASIEPCLVGWSDTDENGVDVYCFEQPGGAIQCKTVAANPKHEECALQTQPDGRFDISCDEDAAVEPVA